MMGGVTSFPAHMTLYHSSNMGMYMDGTEAKWQWDPDDPAFPDPPPEDAAIIRADSFILDHRAAQSAGNPYETVEAFDPGPTLSAIDTAFSAYATVANGTAPTTDWNTFADTAATKAEGLLDGDDISMAVDAFGRKTVPALARAINNITAGMSDINAVTGSSAFVMGVANANIANNAEIAAYRASLMIQRSDKKQALVMQGIEEMMKLQAIKIESMRNALAMFADIGKTKIVAKNDQIGMDLQYAAKEATWYIDLHKSSMSMISAISGVPTVPPPLTKEQQALSTLLSVAAALGPFILPLL